MTFEITDLSPDLCAQVGDVWFDGWHEAHAGIVPAALTRRRTREDFLQRLNGTKLHIRVAVNDKDVLGFVATESAQVDQMYVARSGRGTGVAQALMADALAHLRAGGHTVAWLACGIGNARAAAFYEKTGWVNVGEKTVILETTEGPFDLTVWRFEKTL